MADETEIRKPTNMLEALETADKLIDKTLVRSFRGTKEKTPEMSIGASVRMFHFAFIRSLREAPACDVFQPTLGIIAKCLLPKLTDEEKEALRNDKLESLL